MTVGPGGARVSFSAQQRRAAILASLFAKRFEVRSERKKIKVAVVGAGVAGVSLYVLLHKLGFHQSYLFEKDPLAVLTLQLDAPHRLAHPSYNTWPHFERFESTTSSNAVFPWGAGSVVDVLNQIRDQFNAFLENDELARSNLMLGRRAIQILDIPGGSGVEGVRIRFEEKVEFDADFVVATMGFGPEKAVENSTRYWHMDNFETIKRLVRQGEDNKFIVAGNGDGALIDAARVAYKFPTSDTAVFSALHLSTIFELRHSKYKAPTKTRAAAFNRNREDQPKSNYEKKVLRVEKSLKDEPNDKGALAAQQAYAVDPAFQPIQSRIAENLCPQCCAALTIVGETMAPFIKETAPINKIVVANLPALGGRFERGRLMQVDDEGNMEDIQPSIRRPYTLRDKNDRVKLLDEDLNHPNAQVLCRIGAKPHVIDTVVGKESEEFSSHFDQIGDYQELDASFDAYGRSTLEYLNDEIQPNTAEALAPLAGEHVKKWFGNDFSLLFVPQNDDIDPHFKVVHPKDKNPIDAARKLGGFDHHLFGVPTFFSAKSERDDDFMFAPSRARRKA